MPRKKIGNVLVQYLIAPEDKLAIERLAEVQRLSVSEIVRKLIKSYIVKQSKLISETPLDNIIN